MKKGELWLVELPSFDGHEQFGTRPTIIITETEANLTIIIPCTTNFQALRFPYTLQLKPSKKNGLSSLSIALLFQIRAIDKTRLIKKIGELEEQVLNEVNSLLKKMLLL